MSPEVINGKGGSGPLGAQDIWSAGCLVLEMITGKRPWSELDNDWAIMYQIGITNKHPPLPPIQEKESKGLDIKISSSSSVTGKISDDNLAFQVKISEDCHAFLQKCFLPAMAPRPKAADLLKDKWFHEMEQKLLDYRKSHSSLYPSAWSGFITGLYSPGYSINTLGNVTLNYGGSTREFLGSYFNHTFTFNTNNTDA
jgi:serine/threonine protein kinase